VQFLVTVKLPKNPKHDPRNKKSDTCPVNLNATCTDATGEHHTVLWEGASFVDAMSYWRIERGMHVTRIEGV
jgi:hypothetical protein